MTEIVPFLWFDHCADEAVDFYLSVFPGGKRVESLRGAGEGPWKPGQTATQVFEINGLRLVAFNGGPGHPFTEAISLSVSCEDQTEIDRVWDALLAGGGEAIACGWLKDRFGLRWQVVPRNIAALLSKPAAMKAMMSMKKLDIAALEAAGAAPEPND